MLSITAAYVGVTVYSIISDMFGRINLAAVDHSTPVAVFATVIPGVLAILGGIGHILMRQTRNETRITHIENDIQNVQEDLQWLTRQLTGSPPPSRRRSNESA